MMGAVLSIGVAPCACIPLTVRPPACLPESPQRCVGPFEVANESADEIVAGGRLALSAINDSRFDRLVLRAEEIVKATTGRGRARDRAFWNHARSEFWAGSERDAALAILAVSDRGFSVGSASSAASVCNGATVAWEGRSTGPIILSRTRRQAAEAWANTLVHELAHRAGFHHSGDKRAGNECSVPYVAGWVAENLARLRNGRHLAPAECEGLEALFVEGGG